MRAAAGGRRRSAPVDRYHLCFALGKALEDRGEYAESFRYYERGNALKRAESRYRPGDHREQHPPADRGLHRASSSPPPRLGRHRTPIRSSSSACRARARRCSSRSSPRTRRSRARRNCRTSSRSSRKLRGRDPDLNNPRYPRILAELQRRGFRAARRAVPGRHAGLPHRQALLHRQDAEQLPAPRADPPDAAERQDHRRAARADGLLLQQSQAAVRQGPGVHLQHRGHRALLPHLPRADAALGRGAARPGPARPARGRGRRSRRQRAAACSISAAWSSSRSASSSTRPSAACAPRAPSRCASRSSATDSISGRISSPGSGR